MLSIELPGQPALELHHLVLDFNGTLALRGAVVDGVAERLRTLAESLTLHCVTGDTFGTARAALEGLPLHLHVLPPTGQSVAKRGFAAGLDGGVCAIGNGWNDRLMLAEADLGLAVMMNEGAASATLMAARAAFPSILDALDALLAPGRMVAVLRD
ncbi:MAG: ATPase P [Halothiobacillaceae bacterium]|nr:MAG: ATPase P [Halothiobacillaceae bacterium]